ncbi:MAG: hypothetical protein V3T84_03095 [Phycisphaerales bacterium]
MSGFTEILETFGLTRMPWVIRAYFLLLLITVGLLIFAVVQAPSDGTNDNHPAVTLFVLAGDALKVVIGALLGSLSMAAQQRWGKQSESGPAAGDTVAKQDE